MSGELAGSGDGGLATLITALAEGPRTRQILPVAALPSLWVNGWTASIRPPRAVGSV